MARSILFFILLIIMDHCLAQCGMTASIWNDTGCLPSDQGTFGVNTTGGTAPFNILVERHALNSNMWTPASNVSGDPSGDIFGTFNSYTTDQLRVTVTDATNCVATQTNTFQAYANVGSYAFPYPDLCTGNSMVSFQPGASNCPITWMQVHTLFIDGVEVGPVSETCTFDGTWYTITQPFSNGTHTINFSGPSCIQGVIECWYETSFTVGNPYSGDCGVNFYLRAALDGALPSGTVMTDGLRAANLIPTAQPYTALGYTFVGSPTNVSIAPSLLTVTGNNAVEDWVVVELRNANAPYAVVYSKPALLQRDGDVMDTDGNPHLNFPVTAGNYRIALRHRNHLGVMTGSSRALTQDPSASTIDFRLAATNTYGSNARVLKGSVYCLWAGDTNGDGILKYTGSNNDRDPILVAIGGTNPTSTLNNVYDRRDVNLDGMIKYTGANNDRDPILVNIGGTVPTNTRVQQLP